MLRGPCDTELAMGGIAAMLVHRTKHKKVLDSIIMQNMSHNLLLFCARTWLSYHVIEDHLLLF